MAYLPTHAAIALRVDDDGCHPAFDGAHRHPALGNGLPGAGGTHDERVSSARRAPERDRHRSATLVATDHQLLGIGPTRYAAKSVAIDDLAGRPIPHEIQR